VLDTTSALELGYAPVGDFTATVALKNDRGRESSASRAAVV